MHKQRLFKPYLWAVSIAGAIVFLFSIYRLHLPQLWAPFFILGLITVLIASRIVVDFYRFKSSISVSDVFIFLALLLFGTYAAVVIGAIESYYSSKRITSKRLTMVFNAAAMALSTFITGFVLEAAFGPLKDIRSEGYSSVYVVATCAMGFIQYIVNSGAVAVASVLRNNLSLWATYKKHYVWTSITYFAGASAAGITVKLIDIIGMYAF